MGRTTIEWTDFSVSPIRARSKESGKVFHFCERISPGCANCYAATMAHRFGLPDYIKANREKVEFFLDEFKLREVLRRRKPTRYFWEDCSDLFGHWVKEEWLIKCFHVMESTPQHVHQILTKRPERMLEHLSWRWGKREDGPGYRVPARNIWVGVSVEDQKRADERIPLLLKTPAAVRFLSCEPLLGPVDLFRWFEPYGQESCINCGYDGIESGMSREQYDAIKFNNHGDALCPDCGTSHAGLTHYEDCMIDWCVVGGESGPGARPCNIEWIRSLRDQCKAAGVACFVKQLGKHVHTTTPGGQLQSWFPNDKKGGNILEWPADLRVRELPANEGAAT